MQELREITAVTLFCLSVYLTIDLFVSGFSWIILSAAILGFVLVHFIWPEGKRDSDWFDIIELIIELPYQALAFLLRSLGRVLGKSDGGIDIDL